MTLKELLRLAIRTEKLAAQAETARRIFDDALTSANLDYELWQHSIIRGKEGYHWRAKFDSPSLKWKRRSTYYPTESAAIQALIDGTIKMVDEP